MTQPAETVLSTRLDGTEADAKLAHERISEMRRVEDGQAKILDRLSKRGAR